MKPFNGHEEFDAGEWTGRVKQLKAGLAVSRVVWGVVLAAIAVCSGVIAASVKLDDVAHAPARLSLVETRIEEYERREIGHAAAITSLTKAVDRVDEKIDDLKTTLIRMSTRGR